MLVSLTKEGDIYHLGVHIADVSHYVIEGSALDKECVKTWYRAFTLCDRAYTYDTSPAAESGICSLNEGCDRLLHL